jgi:hypothetical protein
MEKVHKPTDTESSSVYLSPTSLILSKGLTRVLYVKPYIYDEPVR